MTKAIQSALISVYHKDGLAPIIHALAKQNVQLISTGGTGSLLSAWGMSTLRLSR